MAFESRAKSGVYAGLRVHFSSDPCEKALRFIGETKPTDHSKAVPHLMKAMSKARRNY